MADARRAAEHGSGVDTLPIGLPAATLHETRTLTLIVQSVVPIHGAAVHVFADALAEYVDDVKRGDAGHSGYERHITKNNCRIDVVASVPALPNRIAAEDISGNGDDALKARLLDMRRAAAFLPGGKDYTAIGSFACSPEEAAKQVRGLLDDQLAAIGVPKDEDEPEPDDEGGT